MTSKLASALAFAIAIHAASFCRGESATPNNMMPTSISAAQWVYPGTERADSPSNAFMRISFDVKGPVKRAEFWWISERSRGTWFNGKPANFGILPRFRNLSGHQKAVGGDFTKLLKPGRNAFAFANFRLQDVPGCFFCFGIILRGEIEYENGQRQVVVSNSGSCRGTGPEQPPDGWREAEFDDSSWGRVWDQGDARLGPWSTYGDIDIMFCSAEEYAAYREALSRGFPEKQLLSEPDSPNARVVYHGTVPAIESNGRIFPPHLFSSKLTWNPARDELLDCAKEIDCCIFKLGIKEQYTVGATDGTENSRLDAWDLQIRRILAKCPDARFSLVYYTHLNAYDKWLKAHPEEAAGFAKPSASKNPSDYSASPVVPSFASEAYRQEVRRFFGQVGAYFRSKPWGRRVIAVNVGYGPSNDGMPYGCNSMPDTGVRMTEAFRRYLAGRYNSDAALQAAWGDPEVTIATATVPDAVQRLGSGLMLRDVSNPKDRRLADYYEAYHKEFTDWHIEFGKSIKQAFPGALVGMHYGYSILSYVPEGSTSGIDELLASPYIDYMNTTVRGYHLTDSLNRHIQSVFHRYGKLSLVEGDVRTHVAKADGRGEFYWTCQTPEETRACVSKIVGNSFFNGSGYYTVDFGNPKWFSCPESIEPFAAGGKIWKDLFAQPPKNAADIAVIFDTDIPWREGRAGRKNTFAFWDNIATYPLQTMNFSGFAYDLYAPEDFAKCGRDYKVVVFLNTFRAGKWMEAAASKARRPGATCVWCYAPALQTDAGYSEASMKAYTGMDLAVKRDEDPLTGTYTNGRDFSFRHVYQYRTDPVKTFALKPDAPRVECRDADASVLAKWSDGAASLARKKLSDGSVAYFAGVPLKRSDEWAALFRAAGCHAYTKPGFYVRRNSRLLMVFSGKGSLIPMESCVMHGQMDQSGSVNVYLERRASSVKDLFTGKIVAKDADSFTLSSELPRVWLMEVK